MNKEPYGMSRHLYEFLKSKGDRFEFCYSGGQPFLLNRYNSLAPEIMEEYAKGYHEEQIKKLKDK